MLPRLQCRREHDCRRGLIIKGGGDHSARHTFLTSPSGKSKLGGEANNRQPATETYNRGFHFPTRVNLPGYIEGNIDRPLFGEAAQDRELSEMGMSRLKMSVIEADRYPREG